MAGRRLGRWLRPPFPSAGCAARRLALALRLAMRLSTGLRMLRDASLGVTGDVPRAPTRMRGARLALRLLAFARRCRGDADKRTQSGRERGAQDATDEG